MIELPPGERPKAWYSPTVGYIVWKPGTMGTTSYVLVSTQTHLTELPEDAAELILKEPWRRFTVAPTPTEETA